MKKILNILMVAAVALGAVACDNAIDDNLTPEQNGESVSITVNIADTRVTLGEANAEGQLPIVFELDDQLCVTDAWGGYGDEQDFWFTCTAADAENKTYTFTCEQEGVSAIVGTKKNVFYFGGAPAGNGAVCNTELESIKGVGMSGSTEALGTEAISLSVSPVLRLTADCAVTLEASTGTFSSSKGRWAESYTTTTTGTIYVPMYSAGTYDLSVIVKGQVVKKATGFTFANNTIYNLGTIEEPEVEKDSANITIDGDFADWDDVTICVATFPEGDTYKPSMKTLKAYADDDKVYLYMEYEPADVCYLDIYFDLDGTTTGESYHRWENNYANVYTEGKIYDWSTDEQVPYDYSEPSKKVYGDGWVTDSSLVITCKKPQSISSTLSAVEWAIDRTESFNALISGDTIYVGAFLMNTSWSCVGFLPKGGSMLAIPLP